MPAPKTVTASLEGAQVVIDDKVCHLNEYDFSANKWLPKESAEWPLSRATAERWLEGWNSVDNFAALCILTETKPERDACQKAFHPWPILSR